MRSYGNTDGQAYKSWAKSVFAKGTEWSFGTSREETRLHLTMDVEHTNMRPSTRRLDIESPTRIWSSYRSREARETTGFLRKIAKSLQKNVGIGTKTSRAVFHESLIVTTRHGSTRCIARESARAPGKESHYLNNWPTTESCQAAPKVREGSKKVHA